MFFSLRFKKSESVRQEGPIPAALIQFLQRFGSTVSRGNFHKKVNLSGRKDDSGASGWIPSVHEVR
jgi:hypothetical protein